MLAQHLSLFKRANGVWYVCYEHYGRRRWKSTGSTTKQGAPTFLTEFTKEKVKTYSRMRFSEFVKHYVELDGYAVRQEAPGNLMPISYDSEMIVKLTGFAKGQSTFIPGLLM
ncbi:MAG: hypothetical protein ABSF91_13905 [Bacteroidota bacterium]|jgi:hypothetical protein